jgi:ribose transport system substrate-binding protein
VFENIIQQGGYKGVAVSPIDPENQADALNKLAAAMPMLCHDSDAPKSNRRFYIGTNNVDAGRAMGAFIKKQLPEGGKIIITVGKLDALNAQQRRQGLIEELGK